MAESSGKGSYHPFARPTKKARAIKRGPVGRCGAFSPVNRQARPTAEATQRKPDSGAVAAFSSGAGPSDTILRLGHATDPGTHSKAREAVLAGIPPLVIGREVD